MMFPLGLSIWRRKAELLPFFWSANGITSMFASVLGMALSIEFGIAKTYALGVCFYVVCAVMIVVSRHANRMGVSAARPVKKLGSLRQDEVASAADPVAPVIQSREIELVADIRVPRSPGASNFTKQTHPHVRSHRESDDGCRFRRGASG